MFTWCMQAGMARSVWPGKSGTFSREALLYKCFLSWWQMQGKLVRRQRARGQWRVGARVSRVERSVGREVSGWSVALLTVHTEG